ncbi:MAG: GNAT family N-acetyltransferase [Pirellulaceae bacterium]
MAETANGHFNMTISDGSVTKLSIQTTDASSWAKAASSLAAKTGEPDRSQLHNDAKAAMRSLKPETFHFLQAKRQSHTVGLAWGQHLPGRMGQIRNVILAQTETSQTARQLISALDQQFEKERIVFSMMALEESPTIASQWLETCGYESLCHVKTLCQLLPTTNPATPSSLEFISGAENQRAELAAIIKATYRQSLDCPKLQQLRSIDDTLDGYQQQGLIPVNGWSFVHHGKAPVGCLLMTAFPGESYWELTYLGLVPKARGQGWGTQILQQACSRAAESGADMLITTVDQANQPALTMYEQLGFMTVDQNEIYAKRIKTAANKEITDR